MLDQIFIGLGWGSLSGLALGLTGGGGSIVAVPLLLYGMHQTAHSAIAISLFAVGTTTGFGALQKIIMKDPYMDWKSGLILAIFGLIFAPFGSKIGQFFSGNVLLILFSLLMLFIGGRMWLKSIKLARKTKKDKQVQIDQRRFDADKFKEKEKPYVAKLTKKSVLSMAIGGTAVGFLSGMLGVGGGFLIVPALTMAGLPIKYAVSTSLLAIFITALSGSVSHFILDPQLNFTIGIIFALGGIIGLNIGIIFVKKLPAAIVQRIFSIFVIAVGIIMFLSKVV